MAGLEKKKQHIQLYYNVFRDDLEKFLTIIRIDGCDRRTYGGIMMRICDKICNKEKEQRKMCMKSDDVML